MDFLPSSDGKESACGAGDLGSIPGLGRFPWRMKWQPTPVHFAWKSHGQRSLVGCSPWGCKESGTTERLTLKRHLLSFTVPFMTTVLSLASASYSGWADTSHTTLLVYYHLFVSSNNYQIKILKRFQCWTLRFSLCGSTSAKFKPRFGLLNCTRLGKFWQLHNNINKSI